MKNIMSLSLLTALSFSSISAVWLDKNGVVTIENNTPDMLQVVFPQQGSINFYYPQEYPSTFVNPLPQILPKESISFRLSDIVMELGSSEWGNICINTPTKDSSCSFNLSMTTKDGGHSSDKNLLGATGWWGDDAIWHVMRAAEYTSNELDMRNPLFRKLVLRKIHNRVLCKTWEQAQREGMEEEITPACMSTAQSSTPSWMSYLFGR